MAKITYGPVVNEASGKIAGVVFSRNRGGPYAKGHSIPTQPNSPRQIAARGAFSFAARRWTETITNPQRQTWEDYASATPVIDRLGEERFLTGQQWFTANQAYFQSALLPAGQIVSLTSAPTSNGVGPAFVNATAVSNSTANTLVLTINTSSADTDGGYAVSSGLYTQNYSRNPGGYNVFTTGDLTWAGGVGTATFTYPNIETGTNYRVFFSFRFDDNLQRVGRNVEVYIDFEGTAPSQVAKPKKSKSKVVKEHPIR